MDWTVKFAMDDEGKTFDVAVAAVRAGSDPDVEARGLYHQLIEVERLGLLDGDTPFWQGMGEMLERYNARPYTHGEVKRIGVPGIRFVDGPRGCVAGAATAFPVSMARGATWDTDLEEQVGEAIGREVRAVGGNFFGGVCINLPRHPAWGRIQETYGDDPHHLGEMGAALTRGAQKYVMACAKHYALNSMENARFHVDVTVDDATLHEVYLPHFKRTVDERLAAIMTAYNSVNGEWAGQNGYLLTDVLRDQWGWDGITVSDFIWGLRDAAASLEAGLDLEEPFSQQRTVHLARQLESGETSWEKVERAGLRLLAAQLRSYASRDPQDPEVDVVANAHHRALAREVAVRAMVLLKNHPVDTTPVLPLDTRAVRRIAVIGRLAVGANMGDQGSSRVWPPTHVTPYDGIRAAFPDADVVLVDQDDPDAAARASRDADVAIVVAGFDHSDEGEYVGADTLADPALMALFPSLPEGLDLGMPDSIMTSGFGGDRDSLRLRPIDEQIIRAVAAANPRTVVSIVAAGAVVCEAWRHDVPAIVMMWYAGMEGGHALADVLTGAHNPSGRLPYSVPTSEAHLPHFDKDAHAITYDRWHGQHLLDRLEVAAAYPHGFGLSYTTFVIRDVSAEQAADGTVAVHTRVSNTGGRDGRHVVQVYGRRTDGPRAGETLLTGFRAVQVPAGRTVDVTVPVSLEALGAWNAETKRLDAPDLSAVDLEVGAHAHDPDARTVAPV
jgi:beta-glucosidase